MHLRSQPFYRHRSANDLTRLEPDVEQRQFPGVHLSGRNIHTLFAGKRCGDLQPRRDGHVLHHPDDHAVLIDVASDGARSVEEFARERPVDYRHVLRIRAVPVDKSTSCQDWNLSCVEIIGCYIHFACHHLLSGFLAIAEVLPLSSFWKAPAS